MGLKDRLGPGEVEAIALALELKADVLLMDDRDGVKAARDLGLFVTGTLGALQLAAERNLCSLANVLDALKRTTFRAPESLIVELLRHDALRRGLPPTTSTGDSP